MDREDSDEAKVAALGQVLAVGENVYVKVAPCPICFSDHQLQFFLT